MRYSISDQRCLTNCCAAVAGKAGRLAGRHLDTVAVARTEAADRRLVGVVVAAHMVGPLVDMVADYTVEDLHMAAGLDIDRLAASADCTSSRGSAMMLEMNVVERLMNF